VAKRRAKVKALPTGRPVIPQGSDIDSVSVAIMPDGRVFQRTVHGFTEEQVARMRAGYTCVKCYEDHDTAFPDECLVCKFPMRDKQTEEFAKDFRGEIAFGPSTSLDEEREIMNDMREREAHERRIALGLSIPKPSIIVPKGF
jgi:hypothetical protein